MIFLFYDVQCSDLTLTCGFASVDFVFMSIGQVFYIKTNENEKLYLDKMNGHLLTRCCYKIKYRP